MIALHRSYNLLVESNTEHGPKTRFPPDKGIVSKQIGAFAPGNSLAGATRVGVRSRLTSARQAPGTTRALARNASCI